jgi:hypothetical protein
LQKRKDGVETTAAENTTIKEWREYHLKHTEMAGCVLGLLLQTLSQPILQHLKHHHDVDSQPPSINEINRIFLLFRRNMERTIITERNVLCIYLGQPLHRIEC